jgi:hypothetical protein
MADITLSEEWRFIEDWPDYEVSNLGRVRRATDALRRGYVWIPKGRVLRPMVHQRGYLFVNLSHNRKSKGFLIHRLVCAAFHGPQPSPDHEVAHWNGDRTNNLATNLRWATSAENSTDLVRHGKSTRGRKTKSVKLTEQQVLIIRELIAKGLPLKLIAKEFSVTSGAISEIKLGRNWAWL